MRTMAAPEDERMSARQQEQRSRMIEENIGLVHACAHRFKGKGIEYDDLFQAGCIGLVKATDAFDSERGVRFSTYAVPVILGEMRRLFRDGGTVKVSRSLKELSMKAARQRDQFAKEHGRRWARERRRFRSPARRTAPSWTCRSPRRRSSSPTCSRCGRC